MRRSNTWAAGYFIDPPTDGRSLTLHPCTHNISAIAVDACVPAPDVLTLIE
jgi:hypothetical protein